MISHATLTELLDASSRLHSHLCPRQVLGVRMGLFAGSVLELPVPQADKRLITIVETDGCATDGISVATGCWVGRRTLRVEDYGKVAATFADSATGRAIRVWPRKDVRQHAGFWAPQATNRWEAQLLGYQVMPDDLMFEWQPVDLVTPLEAIISRPGCRAICATCGEEIMNEREIVLNGVTLCRACASDAYYRPRTTHLPVEVMSRRS